MDVVHYAPCDATGGWARALAAALEGPEDLDAELADLTEAVSAKWGPAEEILHPRVLHGEHGGEFRTVLDRIVDQLRKWAAAGGRGKPFEGFTPAQIRRVATRDRGLSFQRGTSDDDVAAALLKDLRDDIHKPAPAKAAKKVAKKAVPKPSGPGVDSFDGKTRAQWLAQAKVAKGTGATQLDALDAGDRDRAQREMTTLLKANRVELVGTTGAVERFDRTRHEPTGRQPADGTSVQVVRPGAVYTAPDGERVTLSRPVVEETDGETGLAARTVDDLPEGQDVYYRGTTGLDSDRQEWFLTPSKQAAVGYLEGEPGAVHAVRLAPTARVANEDDLRDAATAVWGDLAEHYGYEPYVFELADDAKVRGELAQRGFVGARYQDLGPNNTYQHPTTVVWDAGVLSSLGSADVGVPPAGPVPTGLAASTVDELRALARQRGISIPAGASKADIVKLLQTGGSAEQVGLAA